MIVAADCICDAIVACIAIRAELGIAPHRRNPASESCRLTAVLPALSGSENLPVFELYVKGYHEGQANR